VKTTNMTEKILLGFTVPEGKPFHIPKGHTVITGMTNLSGKSTTVEALMKRSPDTKCLVFLTKRGEKVFQDARNIPPYYKERFDWEYVRSLLAAAWHEKMKFETPWIIRIAKRTTNLVEFRKALSFELDKSRLREFDRNVYTVLAAYLDKVLPVLEGAKEKFSEHLILKPGMNVMDLTEWYTNEEVQMVVIRSCMEYILKHENNVTVGLPEAWKLLPQSRNTPVKLYFEKFIREGATNNNYLILDAQDLGGVDKTPLRQVSVWIMGRMMEANEVARLLKQTLGLKIPPVDVQTLSLGHFLVAYGKGVQKVYVWPMGVPEKMAIAVAQGNVTPEIVKELITDLAELRNSQEANSSTAVSNKVETLKKEIVGVRSILDRRVDSLTEEVSEIKAQVQQLYTRFNELPTYQPPPDPDTPEYTELQQTLKTVEVSTVHKTFRMTDESMDGKVMVLAKTGFLDSWHSEGEIRQKLRERGWAVLAKITLYKALQKLVNEGFLGKMKKGAMKYKLAPNVRFQ